MKMDRPHSSDNSDQQAYWIAFLIAGFIQDRLSPEEHRELDDWVTASMDNQRLFEELTDPTEIEAGKAALRRSRPEELLQQVKRRLQFNTPQRPAMVRRIWPYLASACLVIVIVVTFLKSQDKNAGVDMPRRVLVAKDLPPGSNKAILILADGTARQLDSTAQGKLATQGGASVLKDDSDRLVYQTNAIHQAAVPVVDILRVPRGGQFQLRLADGTRVWLNAESSLKYPSTFTGKERAVELSGEGYFEVAQDPRRPFIVHTAYAETQVLGTSFDINTYPENTSIQVTVAEGMVKVAPSGVSQKGGVLRPGQQAQVGRAGTEMKIVPADVVTTLAWKNGQFIFQNTPLAEVLAQISRWYNVSVADSTTTANHYNASIPRGVPVSRLLHMLELTGQVHFRIGADKITATN